MEHTGGGGLQGRKRSYLDDSHDRILGSPPFSSSPPARRQRLLDQAERDILSSPVASHFPSSSSASKSTPVSQNGSSNSFGRNAPASITPVSLEPDTTSPTFDRDTFEAFVGDKVSPEALEIIRENCGGNIEKAVNMYFDGTWKTLKKRKAAAPLSTSIPTRIATHPGNGHSMAPSLRQSMPDSRYIGAFGVEGWATRSGANLLKHGDIVKIERQKIQPPQPAAVRGRTKVGGVAPVRMNSAAAKRVDVIVRFTNSSGMEIGRLAKDTANWVSTLMDQRVCKFEGTCVYAPERLRTNDTIFLQLRCSLLRSAFSSRVFQEDEPQKGFAFEGTESSEERELRLRQVALVRLFQEINLLPTTVNAAAAKYKRQGLLEAAELSEKREKEAAKPGNR